MQKCGCTPGNMENGWKETRSKACELKERLAWKIALRRYRVKHLRNMPL